MNAYWEFTTEYNKLSPEDHAIGLPVSATKLDWQDVPGVTEYQYCLDTDEYCTIWVTAGTTSQIILSGLEYASTYYWQVRAYVGTALFYADGSQAAYWKFDTEDLEKISPENGAIDQPITNLILDWGVVTGAVEYQYCLYTDVVCTDDDWVSTAETSTTTLINLFYSTTYYWQVRANVGTVDVAEWLYADGEAFWYFTTIADPTIITP